MTSDFSIVTPSFNQAQFVRHTLESVRSQKNVSVQHIVVDPGSTDGSQTIINEFDHATFIQKSDRCQSEGINNGFAECTGRYIAWLNSDDIYPSNDILEQVKSAFLQDKSIDVVYGNATFIDEDGSYLKNYFVNGKVKSLGESLEYQVGICQPAVFWRREVYLDIGGLDESLDYQLDYEYWIRMHQAVKKWKHLNAPLASHRWWPGMKTASKRKLSLIESLNLVKQRYGYVHYKWAERYAALEVSESDGIINVGNQNDLATKERTRDLLIMINTDSATLERLRSKDASNGMVETLQLMDSYGVDCFPRFLDARQLNFADEPPEFLSESDRVAKSIPRRPEVRHESSTGKKYVIYTAEPQYSIAQDKIKYLNDQKTLSSFLDSCKDTQAETCIVVANGPSLTQSLGEQLYSFDLIISNFAYKHEALLEHAKYFTIVNHTVAAQVYADWPRLERLTKIFPFWIGRYIPDLPNTYFVNSTVEPEFSGDARKYLSWRSTVSYYNIQLAVSLGYKRIVLVGFDHSYIQPKSVQEGDEIIQKEDDPNHFIPNYFKGKSWQAADTGNMNASYVEALRYSFSHNIEIVNCTAGGKLEVFPRADLNSILELPDRQVATDWKRLTSAEIAAISTNSKWRAILSCSNQYFKYSELPADLREFFLNHSAS